MYRIIYFVLLVVTIASCSKSDNHLNSYIGFDIPKDTIEAYLNSKIDEYNIPGMSIAFIEDGKIVYHDVLGYANLETQSPVTNATIFEAASLSKSVFAHFVMTYVDAGKLDLDTPLYTYWPYPDIAYDERYKTITARMVLSHRAGFPNWRNDTPGDSLKIHSN